MRSFASQPGIASVYTNQGAFFGWLLRITQRDSTVRRHTSLDANFTFGGQTYSALDMELPNLSWDGSVFRPATLVIGDYDNHPWWDLATSLALSDAKVELLAIYQQASAEALEIWSGRLGEVSRDGWRITFQLSNDSEVQSAPRLRVQQAVDETYLIAGGAIFYVNGQPWQIQRATTGAG